MPLPCIPSPMSHLKTFLICYALGVLTGWSVRSNPSDPDTSLTS